MKSFNFLKKIEKEGKLSLVEGSENVKTAYLKKAESNLVSAKILLKEERLEESVTLAYYSMYNSLRVLLFKVGIKCDNHSASIILMKELFDLNNSKIEFAKKERVDKQYYADFSIAVEDVKELLGVCEEFNAEMFDFIEKISASRIKDIKLKLGEVLE